MNDEIKFSSFIITATIHKKFLVYSFRSHFLKKFILLSSKFEIKQHNDGGDLTYRMFIRYMQKYSLLLPRVIQCHLPHQLDHWTPAEKKQQQQPFKLNRWLI